jgi:hypothetical protein
MARRTGCTHPRDQRAVVTPRQLLIRHADVEDHHGGTGFLDGAAGTALALHTAAHNVAPISGWDACLLIE